MRLTSKEVGYIKNIIKSVDNKAVVYLFGSRVKDELKGGDIDLLVFSKKIKDDDRRSIKIKMYDALGEQKIDLVLASNASATFVEIAKREGIPL